MQLACTGIALAVYIAPMHFWLLASFLRQALWSNHVCTRSRTGQISRYYWRWKSAKGKCWLCCIVSRRWLTPTVTWFVSLHYDFHAWQEIHGRPVTLLKKNGLIYCVDSLCYHQGGPLAEGDIEEFCGIPTIRCPWHAHRVRRLVAWYCLKQMSLSCERFWGNFCNVDNLVPCYAENLSCDADKLADWRLGWHELIRSCLWKTWQTTGA